MTDLCTQTSSAKHEKVHLLGGTMTVAGESTWGPKQLAHQNFVYVAYRAPARPHDGQDRSRHAVKVERCSKVINVTPDGGLSACHM